MSAGMRSGAKTRLGAAVLLAIAIALGFADTHRAATTGKRLELTERYGVRPMWSVRAHGTQALAHRPESRRDAADRNFGAPPAVPVIARLTASSPPPSDNGRTWLVTAA